MQRIEECMNDTLIHGAEHPRMFINAWHKKNKAFFLRIVLYETEYKEKTNSL